MSTEFDQKGTGARVKCKVDIIAVTVSNLLCRFRWLSMFEYDKSAFALPLFNKTYVSCQMPISLLLIFTWVVYLQSSLFSEESRNINILSDRHALELHGGPIWPSWSMVQ